MSNSKYNDVEEIEVERNYNVDARKTFKKGQLPEVFNSWPYLQKPKKLMWYEFWKISEYCNSINNYINEFRKITRLYINACHKEILHNENYPFDLENENNELHNSLLISQRKSQEQEKTINDINKQLEEKEIKILNLEKELNLYRKAFGKKGGTGGGWETTNSPSPK